MSQGLGQIQPGLLNAVLNRAEAANQANLVPAPDVALLVPATNQAIMPHAAVEIENEAHERAHEGEGICCSGGANDSDVGTSGRDEADRRQHEEEEKDSSSRMPENEEEESEHERGQSSSMSPQDIINSAQSSLRNRRSHLVASTRAGPSHARAATSPSRPTSSYGRFALNLLIMMLSVLVSLMLVKRAFIS